MASYAYYCLHKFHWTPSKFMNLPRNERAFVVAAINKRAKEDKRQMDKAKRKK